MARSSYQKGKIEMRSRKHGIVYVLRYRLRQGNGWIQKTEQLEDGAKRLCKTPKEAQKAADARMREINTLNTGPQSRSGRRMTMAKFVDGLWQHHKSKVKVSTAYHYDSLMKLYILPAFGPWALVEITPEDLTLFSLSSIRRNYRVRPSW